MKKKSKVFFMASLLALLLMHARDRQQQHRYKLVLHRFVTIVYHRRRHGNHVCLDMLT